MPRPFLSTAAALAAGGALVLATTVPAMAGKPPKGVELSAIGTHFTDSFDASAAEIVEHDPLTHRLFVVNAEAGAFDVLDASDPSDPSLLGEASVAGLAAADGSTIDEGAQVNSVSVNDGVVAVAVEAADKVSPGWVAFFSTSGDVPFLAAVRIGVQPDMVTFTPDGSKVVTADEAEPADDFSSDPEGSISVVDVAAVLGGAGQTAVQIARFTAFEGDAEGVRVYGPDVPVPSGQPDAGLVSRNLEPEYVAVDQQSHIAYVSLQEANTIAVVDLATASVTRLLPLGYKNWAATEAGFDASNDDDEIDLQQWPVFGVYEPDGIAAYQVRGQTYLVTANEGDAREWGDYVDSERLADSAYDLCADAFDADTIAAAADDEQLGRLNVSEVDGIREAADGEEACREQIVALGGRSFSIWTTDGDLVFDSGSQFEELLRDGAGGIDPLVAFNANNDDNDSFDSRSDDKGPEPEGVTIGQVDGRSYAFIGLERAGGVMTFNIDDPAAPYFVNYFNNRDFSADAESRAAGDLGPEGLAFISAEDSPIGDPLLAVANEVSGTTTVFAIAGTSAGH
jgi:DNA-binding beta-propeller fold protein YncE